MNMEAHIGPYREYRALQMDQSGHWIRALQSTTASRDDNIGFDSALGVWASGFIGFKRLRFSSFEVACSRLGGPPNL